MNMKNFFKVAVNHWKKCLLGVGIVSYGVNYGVDNYRMFKMLRAYCDEAVKYGDQPSVSGHVRRISVILNPAANNKKAKKLFEKYCAPILYLSGIYISVLETEREGHAKDLIDKIDPKTDAIVIAGGDGTLSEALTGIMRRKGELCKIPVGVLPLGKTNTLANSLYAPKNKNNELVEWMAEASMAIVKGATKPIDAYRIEVLQNDSNENNNKAVYGVGKIEWGIRRELKRRSETLWFLGPLSGFASLVFTGSGLHTDTIAQHHSRGLITAKLRYTAPCSGCSKCYLQRPDLVQLSTSNQTKNENSKWWNVLSLKHRRAQIQSEQKTEYIDYTSIINEQCTTINEKVVNTSDLCLTTLNVISNDDNKDNKENAPHVLLKIGPKVKNQAQIIKHGMKLLKEDEDSIFEDKLMAKQIEIQPILNDKELVHEKNVKEDCLSIDNEDYEVRPIKVTILPNSVNVFCL